MGPERHDADVEPSAVAADAAVRSGAGLLSSSPLTALNGRGELDPRAGPRSVAGLQRMAGNRATARAVQRSAAAPGGLRWLSRIGYRLDKPLPSSAPTPVEDHSPNQRKWNKTDFYAFWEAEQGRKLSTSEKKTVDRGCIGITANNLEGGGNPSLVEVYDSFSAAHSAMYKHNNTVWNTYFSSSLYVMFGMLFWSNQDPDVSKRATPDPTAFRGDPKTHRVDMSGYQYRAQPGKVNFDYGFWDESTSSFWHANHKDFGPDDPMIVYQSTRDKFAHPFTMPDGTERYGYDDFDRAVYGVAVANNYDVGKAKTP